MYTDSVFDRVCYIFGESFVEFWVVKLPVTLSFVFLGVIITVALPLSAGLMTMSFRSVRFLRASRSCLVRLSAIFKGLAFSISLVLRCMKSPVKVLCFCLKSICFYVGMGYHLLGCNVWKTLCSKIFFKSQTTCEIRKICFKFNPINSVGRRAKGQSFGEKFIFGFIWINGREVNNLFVVIAVIIFLILFVYVI